MKKIVNFIILLLVCGNGYAGKTYYINRSKTDMKVYYKKCYAIADVPDKESCLPYDYELNVNSKSYVEAPFPELYLYKKDPNYEYHYVIIKSFCQVKETAEIACLEQGHLYRPEHRYPDTAFVFEDFGIEDFWGISIATKGFGSKPFSPDLKNKTQSKIIFKNNILKRLQ